MIFKNFSTKTSSIWWALPGGSVGKDWFQWRGCQNKITPAGSVVSERPPEEKFEPRKFQFPNPRDLMGHEGEPGSWWRVGRQGKDQGAIFKGEKEACLKDPQREDILYQDILLQSKCQGTLVDMCMAFYTPGAVGGGSFKKMWPLAPRHPLTPNHKIFKEQPAIDSSAYG